ncbi:MAG: MotE family protein [Hyphomicrobiaceae bacterium]
MRRGAAISLLLATVLSGGAAVAGDNGWAPVVVTTIETPAPAMQPLVPAARPILVPSRPQRFETGATQRRPVETRILPAPRIAPPATTAAATNEPPAPAAAPAVAPAPTERTPKIAPSALDQPIAQQYCVNITDAAADARFAWQTKTLAEIEQEIDKRITRLEEKTKEYKEWLARRDEYAKKAQQLLVGIFGRMQPDAAAIRLAEMDEETAASILSKLDVKISSGILGEMEPTKAAALTTTMAGAAKVTSNAKPKPNGGRKS